jgi:penicillin amidase
LSSRRTWFVRLLWFVIIFTIIVAFLTGGGVLWLRRAIEAQLPPVDGTLHIRAILAPVTVRRDARGTPHIEAQSVDDLLAAQGYVTAQDRLWQMDMLRRVAAGNAAEVLGPPWAAHDRMQRVLLMLPTAQHLVEALSPQDREFLDAYARGVNAEMEDARAGGHLPAEFLLLRYTPQPWTAVDSMLVVLQMTELLDTQWPTKLARARIEARLGPALAADLYPTGSWRDHPPGQAMPDLSAPPPPAVPLDSSQSSLDGLLRLQNLVRMTGECADCRAGSNEWVVSGAHTASGRPLLANDMHLPHQVPNIWYMADLRAGSFHAAGLTLPGMPLIIAGHNDHVAWGYTALGGDTQDVYVEKLDSRGWYWSGERWKRMQRRHETVHVRWGRDESFDVLRTEQGPVLNPLLPDEERVLSLAWTIYDPSLAGMPLYAMNTAANWQQFRDALRQWWAPTLNVVYADDAGHIGYQAAAKIPLRPGGLVGVPITDRTAHPWRGFITFDDLPTVYDPPGGILATANSRVTPNGDPYPLTLAWFSPYRNERIWKWLTGKNGLTRRDMLTLQTDIYSPVDQELAQRFAYAIDHTADAGRRTRDAADFLRFWDGVVGTNSTAAAIVSAAKAAFWRLVLEPRLGNDWALYHWPEKDFAEEQLVVHAPAAWLPANYRDWNALLTAVVARGLDDADAPSNLRGWTYGKDHTVVLRHPLYGHLPFFGWTGVGPQPESGDGTTVKQTARGFGPSQRFTMDWGDVDGSTENIVLGESGDPMSPYYKDEWGAWYDGATFPLPYRATAVQAATRHTLELLP